MECLCLHSTLSTGCIKNHRTQLLISVKVSDKSLTRI